MSAHDGARTWPVLELHEWLATRDTLHMWLQIIGKVRFVQTPWINHSWHATLYVTSRGLTTSPIPHGNCEFQIDLDSSIIASRSPRATAAAAVSHSSRRRWPRSITG